MGQSLSGLKAVLFKLGRMLLGMHFVISAGAYMGLRSTQGDENWVRKAWLVNYT